MRLDARLDDPLDARLSGRLDDWLSMFGSICGSMYARLNVRLGDVPQLMQEYEITGYNLQLDAWLGCTDFWLVSLFGDRSWVNESFGFALMNVYWK